ncbi:MAG: ATP-binding protein [Oscillospiraceae bacterium]|nr:ATP-binding protein [Oscillospiraceae bacterium]
MPFAEESLGNQNLLRILPSFLSVIENGGILLIDEFSSGFHNELENLLVRYFMEKSRFAQMLFVSHSTNLLSNSILRPDQEYSVEFQSDTGSSVKRFSSEQPRSAQNIEKMYVSGVFGGLPEYKEVDHEIQ